MYPLNRRGCCWEVDRVRPSSQIGIAGDVYCYAEPLVATPTSEIGRVYEGGPFGTYFRYESVLGSTPLGL